MGAPHGNRNAAGKHRGYVRQRGKKSGLRTRGRYKTLSFRKGKPTRRVWSNS